MRLILPLALMLFSSSGCGEVSVNRRLAITVDDLPVATSVDKTFDEKRRITLRLLSIFADRNIAAIGFVNESQLYIDGHRDESLVDLLRLWLAAGQDLGNHGFSHTDYHRVDATEFFEDVLRGQVITSGLLAERDRKLRYFRHPYLHTGTSLTAKHALEAMLSDNGYRVAPVTIDNSEWIFARAYDLALQSQDLTFAETVGTEYVNYMLQMVEFYENQSRQLFHRNIDQVLLVHANALNAACLGTLADRLADRGYAFIGIDEALKDPAYASDDRYVGPGGITWLHRWALTREVDPALFRGEPETPSYVLEYSGQREHWYQEE